MPLYISMVFKLMKEQGIHEGCIEQINRLMTTSLYGDKVALDDNQRIRMDDWELREDIQQACRDLWPLITTENLAQKTDYAGYKRDIPESVRFWSRRSGLRCGCKHRSRIRSHHAVIC